MYAEVEARVLQAGTNLKEGLAETDGAIMKVFDELNNADILVTQDEQYVLQKWELLNSMCRQRSGQISAFEMELEGVERCVLWVLADAVCPIHPFIVLLFFVVLTWRCLRRVTNQPTNQPKQPTNQPTNQPTV